jgi:MFS family permease
MVYQTIPVLVRSPLPLGFGGDALASANIQLPFMIVLFVGTILSGFLLNKIGNIRLLVFGTAISAIGFLSLFLFHSSDPWVAAGLTVISCGLALSMAGVFNLILISVPMRLTGIALGMTVLLNMIGISIGPAIGGIFQQLNQGTVTRILGSFPNANAYNMIFLTALVLSVFSFVLAILISRRKGVNVGEISKI